MFWNDHLFEKFQINFALQVSVGWYRTPLIHDQCWSEAPYSMENLQMNHQVLILHICFTQGYIVTRLK